MAIQDILKNIKCVPLDNQENPKKYVQIKYVPIYQTEESIEACNDLTRNIIRNTHSNFVDQFFYLSKYDLLEPVSGKVAEECRKKSEEIALNRLNALSRAKTYFVD